MEKICQISEQMSMRIQVLEVSQTLQMLAKKKKKKNWHTYVSIGVVAKVESVFRFQQHKYEL